MGNYSNIFGDCLKASEKIQCKLISFPTLYSDSSFDFPYLCVEPKTTQEVTWWISFHNKFFCHTNRDKRSFIFYTQVGSLVFLLPHCLNQSLPPYMSSSSKYNVFPIKYQNLVFPYFYLMHESKILQTKQFHPMPDVMVRIA